MLVFKSIVFMFDKKNHELYRIGNVCSVET